MMNSLDSEEVFLLIHCIVGVVIITIAAMVMMTTIDTTATKAKALEEMVKAGANPMIATCAIELPYETSKGNLCLEAFRVFKETPK